MAAPPASVKIDLSAVVVTARDQSLRVLVRPAFKVDGADNLPLGPFDPRRHRTFELALRSFVRAQTGIGLGYVEQLYTFGDRGRHMIAAPRGSGDMQEPHIVSVGYLALTRISDVEEGAGSNDATAWRPWTDYMPWEDWRNSRPDIIDTAILPALTEWAAGAPPADAPPRALARSERLALAFGLGATPWNEENALERYELLYEAGLVEEAYRDGRPAALRRGAPTLPSHAFGRPMAFDHRRILATAISRLRAKIKYRPVVFELMPATFTLTQLQQLVEAIFGRHVHKQNFRRLVESAALVEPTGGVATGTGGRPAALFRFRQDVRHERPSPGLRVGSR